MGDKKGPDWVGVPIAFLFRSAQLGHKGREREMEMLFVYFLTYYTSHYGQQAESLAGGGKFSRWSPRWPGG